MGNAQPAPVLGDWPLSNSRRNHMRHRALFRRLGRPSDEKLVATGTHLGLNWPSYIEVFDQMAAQQTLSDMVRKVPFKRVLNLNCLFACLVMALVAGGLAIASDKPGGKVEFNRDIRP